MTKTNALRKLFKNLFNLTVDGNSATEILTQAAIATKNGAATSSGGMRTINIIMDIPDEAEGGEG